MAKTKTSKKQTKLTRATAMAGILRRTAKKPMTKEQMVSAMEKSYGGSHAEAKYQVTVAVNLLSELGQLKTSDDGKLSLSV